MFQGEGGASRKQLQKARGQWEEVVLGGSWRLVDQVRTLDLPCVNWKLGEGYWLPLIKVALWSGGERGQGA